MSPIPCPKTIGNFSLLGYYTTCLAEIVIAHYLEHNIPPDYPRELVPSRPMSQYAPFIKNLLSAGQSVLRRLEYQNFTFQDYQNFFLAAQEAQWPNKAEFHDWIQDNFYIEMTDTYIFNVCQQMVENWFD